MNERPLLSCIIPAYNSSKTIERAVYSLIDQGLGDDLQIIIADDDSPTPFFYLVENDFYQFKHNIYVRIPPHPNHTPAYTQYYAMRWVTGQYMINLDHDDFIVQDSLKKIIEKIKKENSKNHVTQIITNPLYLWRDGIVEEEEAGLVLTHGKIYDVDFIRANNIKFENRKMYQDLQFNLHFYLHMICQHSLELYLDDNFYVWTDEPTSITHQNPEMHEKHYAEFMYKAHKSTLNLYRNRYYDIQPPAERERVLCFFIDGLIGLAKTYSDAYKVQRHFFTKQTAKDIMAAFEVELDRIIEELKKEWGSEHEPTAKEIIEILTNGKELYLCF